MCEANSETDKTADQSNMGQPEVDDEGDEVPAVGEMTLEEIEEDFDYLFLNHVGGIVMTAWMIATAITMFVYLIIDAKTSEALITLGVLIAALFPCYILCHVLAIRLTANSPRSPLKYRFVWTVSVLLNGPTGIVLVKMPHDRIEQMFIRRSELLREQGLEPYSPVDPDSDRKWQALSRLLLEKVPLGAAFVVQGWFVLLLLVAIVAGIGAVVQFVMSL